MDILTYLQALDTQLLEAIRHAFLIDAVWYNYLVLFFSDLQPILLSLFLVWLWLYGTYHHEDGPKHVALDIFWHVLGAFAVYWILNHFLPLRPRPEAVTSLPALINHLPDNSFPSGHAIFFGASWWAIVQLTPWRNIAIACFVIGFLTCLTRIIAGVHYPGDIIVGFLLGWWLVELFTLFPHGKKYQKFGHDLPVKLVSYIRL